MSPKRRLKAAGASDPPSNRNTSKPSISSATSFLFFLLPHLFATIYSPIPDCDEVFNYWEASHYLNHGYGLQTWEYSPIYAIRSWTYAGLHAAIIAPFKPISHVFGGKVAEFYFLRVVLGLICAICETRLFHTISRSLSYRIALLFMLVTTTSTGMFHASTAYLPSSFAMYTTMLGTSAFMDWTRGVKTTQGIQWFGIGAVLGWPFAAALVFPFMAMETLWAIFDKSILSMIQKSLNGAIRSLIVLAIQTGIDSFFYQQLVCVPWNIIAYNIFSGSTKGPSIYGTEPWHYYIRNLILNFGVWFPLALAAIPLVLLQHIIGSQPVSHASILKVLTYASPLYLWLGIFTIQPHKEERFMYPIYPFVSLNAGIAFHIILQFIGHLSTLRLIPRIPPAFKLVVITSFVLAAIGFSFLRTASLITGYTAPLHIYSPLNHLAKPGDTVCLGKEWYRFPSSYFLPDGVHAKFIKSGFSGLLPGEYSEIKSGFGIFPGTWMIPPGMNDLNREDPGKYTPISDCTFLVDSYFPSADPSALEPRYILDTENWEQVACESFLDAQGTKTLGRLIWLPAYQFIPYRFRRQWADYCLLQRKSRIR